MCNTDLRKIFGHECGFDLRPRSKWHLESGEKPEPRDRAERADQTVVGGEPVLGHLAGIHDVRQADKHRVGEPMAAQIMPNPLDRIELRAVRRQLH